MSNSRNRAPPPLKAKWLRNKKTLKKILQSPLINQERTKLVLDQLCSLNVQRLMDYQDPVLNMLPMLLQPG
jgi:F0F1-type ATP synthase delta subunit